MKHLSTKKYFFILSLSLSTLIFQCRKNEDVTINQPVTPVYVSGGVYGTVVNDQGKPEAYVNVSYGTTNVLTDQNGIFVLQNQLLDESGAQIKFAKQGYFTVYKTVLPIKNKMVSTQLRLIPKQNYKSINSVTGDAIIVNGNAQITLLPNSIVDANGKLFNGTVEVFAHWIDPVSVYTPYEMPGNLTGRDNTGKQVILQTLGMLIVELEDASGNPLNIATGKTAELKFPIASSQNSIAQSTIPMWYYNASQGGWIEDGIANKQGSNYIANVKHFSTWNCDYPYPLVKVSGHVLDKSGNAIANVEVQIKNDKTNWASFSTTTDDGYFVGIVPESASCSLTLTPNSCLSPFTMNFNSSTSDVNLGNITTNYNSVLLTAQLVDCNSNGLSNGYLIIQSPDSINSVRLKVFFPGDANGNIAGHICPCPSTNIIYAAVDLINLKESVLRYFSYDNQLEIVLGQVKACDALNNIIIVNLNGKQNLFTNATCSSIGQQLDIFGLGEANDSSYVSFRLPGVNLNAIQFPNSFSIGGSLGSYYYSCQNGCNSLNLKITQYGAIGEQVIGSFDGSFKDWITLQVINISGDFSVERKN